VTNHQSWNYNPTDAHHRFALTFPLVLCKTTNTLLRSLAHTILVACILVLPGGNSQPVSPCAVASFIYLPSFLESDALPSFYLFGNIRLPNLPGCLPLHWRRWLAALWHITVPCSCHPSPPLPDRIGCRHKITFLYIPSRNLES
jgi:hypothetical protein